MRSVRLLRSGPTVACSPLALSKGEGSILQQMGSGGTPPPPPLRKHCLVQAPGPGLTVTFTEFSDHGFYGQKLGKA